MDEIINLIQEKLENAKRVGERIGILEGIEEGEFRERMNIAYAMLEAGESSEKILAYTKTTKQDIEEYMD